MIGRAVSAIALVAFSVPAHAAFNPVEFFRGRTHGQGQLKAVFQAPKTIEVDSLGFQDKDGTMVIKQVINEPSKPPRTRYWRLRETSPSHYQGTLTDAASAVKIVQDGDSIRIHYRGKDHLIFDQLLTPAGPGKVRNRMKVRRFGIIVAHFDETIRKLD